MFDVQKLKGVLMNTKTILNGVGIVLVCTGIHFGLSALLPLIIFAAGLGFLFLA